MSETDKGVYPNQMHLVVELTDRMHLSLEYAGSHIILRVDTDFINIHIPLRQEHVNQVARFLALWVTSKRD